MVFSGLNGDFLQNNACYPESSHMHCDEALLIGRSVESVSQAYTTWRCQFTKFGPTSQSVLQSLWTTVILNGCKCSRFVLLWADDTDRPIYCTSWAKYFLGDASNLAPASFRLSARLVHVQLLSRIETVNISANCCCICNSCFKNFFL